MEDLLNLLRVQRHDFMNHLQVVSGYIQLDKCEQAKEYIGQVSLELQKTGQIFKIGDFELILQLLLSVQSGFEKQVEFSVDLEENISGVKVSKGAKECIINIANKIIEIVKPDYYGGNVLLNLDIDELSNGYLFIYSVQDISEELENGLRELMDLQQELLESRGIEGVYKNLEEHHELVLTIPKV